MTGGNFVSLNKKLNTYKKNNYKNTKKNKNKSKQLIKKNNNN